MNSDSIKILTNEIDDKSGANVQLTKKTNSNIESTVVQSQKNRITQKSSYKKVNEEVKPKNERKTAIIKGGKKRKLQ